MKKQIGRFTVVVGLVLAGAAARGETDAVTQWRFDTAANPAVPEVAGDLGVGAQAVVTPGELGLGWQKQFPGFGDRTGYWDLGKGGSITFNLAHTAAVPYARRLSVQVCQWFDGGIYSQLAAVSAPGATSAEGNVGDVTPGNIGGWVAIETLLTVPANTPLSSVLVSGASTGSVIDSVSFAVDSASASPPILSIRTLGGDTGQVEISWPLWAGSGGLETTSDLGSPNWTPVQDQPQALPDRYAVVTSAGGAAKFFRLKQ